MDPLLSSFQSHFGLILTSMRAWMRKRRRISIPFWSDFNLLNVLYDAVFPAISIPFWSDFNPRCYRGDGQEEEFQSHFGLILTRIWSYQSSPAWLFQSHFGLILTTLNRSFYVLVLTFQSHFGLILTLCHAETPEEVSDFNPILVWF